VEVVVVVVVVVVKRRFRMITRGEMMMIKRGEREVR
jgi:hypothetical protein